MNPVIFRTHTPRLSPAFPGEDHERSVQESFMTQ
jgi:hypothetical protein